MSQESTGRARLCPNCANTIDEKSVKCPYCKAEFSADFVPQWLHRNAPASEARTDVSRIKKFPIPAKFVWSAAALALILIAFYIGTYLQRTQMALTAEAYSKQLQTKDQTITDQETQLTRLRQQLNDKTNELAELKTKFDESQKTLAGAQHRLTAANRDVDRLNTTRSAAVTRTTARASDASPSYPARPAVRRTEPSVYETVRRTSVYENPSAQARVISQIGSGTRITVVSSAGDWLEVRSKHGNPPGYVRSDDARLVNRVN